jgi:thiol-disulfide isomerase/thioredoxin
LYEIQKIYPAFARKFPDHPYTTLVRDILNGVDKIKVGGQFVDFTLPDLNGRSQTLSELIKGKVAVIDLWATWCGPCIKHCREMVPVYEDYHDRGFTIVGVAAEIKDTDAMKRRLDKEKWPWVNLVELDHQNHIWDKYGASFGGGKIIMVDKNGVILAINPTAEEVRKKLEETL